MVRLEKINDGVKVITTESFGFSFKETLKMCNVGNDWILIKREKIN
tara:strand:+ start:3097 stop:3234 length:138 start_codon:yes stop_codon:yes gene_type:complete